MKIQPLQNNTQHIGACVIVLDKKNNKILLGKRLNSYKSGLYGLPGGRIEQQESLQNTAKRELKEEVGVESLELVYIGVVRENQITYDFIHFVFLCTSYAGNITLKEPDKCEKWEWFSLDDLPKNILRGHKYAVELYKDKTFLKDIISS